MTAQHAARQASAPALRVCVLGVAGVGKSTLLNALLSDWMPLLPQGGVGSFTSAPVRIVHASEPYLAVRRRAAQVLGPLLAALASGTASRAQLQEARLLVQGTQFGDASPGHLHDALLAALAGRITRAAAERDRDRLGMLAQLLAPRHDAAPLDGWAVWHAGAQLPELRHELEHNAAGFLSPLAGEIVLGWAAPFLAHLELIDLPGLGVAHDVLQRHAEAALATARAVLLVVDRSGITDAVAAALARILPNLESGEPRARLLVAMTQLDQIASEQRTAEPTRTRRPWQAHFDELGEAGARLVRGQLARLPSRVAPLHVVHTAPLEHRRYHRADPEDPSRLRDERGAGVVELREALAALGHGSRDEPPTPETRRP